MFNPQIKAFLFLMLQLIHIYWHRFIYKLSMILSDRSSKFSLLRDLKRHLKTSVPSTQKLECLYTCNIDHSFP